MTTTLYVRTVLTLSLFVALGALATSAYAEERGSLDRPVSNIEEQRAERPYAPTQNRMTPPQGETREVRPETPANRMVPPEVRGVVEARSGEAAERAREMRIEYAEAMEARKMQLEQNRILLQERVREAEARRASIEETRAERIDAAQARAFAQALTPLKRGITILEAAIARMHTLTDRIESRIQKISEEGRPVEEALGLTARSRAEIDAAAQTLRTIEARLSASSEGENPREVIADVRSALRAVHESLRGVQAHLRAAVESLR